LVARLKAAGGGTLLAVDYALAEQVAERPWRHPEGTLVGYRGGRQVEPVPDGCSDLTSHVCLQAVAAAGEAAGAITEQVATQAEGLRALGVAAAPAGPIPVDGAGILARLALRSQLAEVLDPGGLGGFGWLIQRVPPTQHIPTDPALRPGD
jgi:SAM-dependent MidA family methyltransferase